MAAYVTIYNKLGEPEKHTLANARDAVAHSGYSWKPGRKWTPIESAPYARPALANDTTHVQKLLDGVGGSAKPIDVTITDAVEDDDPVVIEEGPDPASAAETPEEVDEDPVVIEEDGAADESDAADEDEAADEAEEAAPSGRRGRGRNAGKAD